MTHDRLRALLGTAWLVFVAGAFYLFVFHRIAIQAQLGSATSTSAVVGALLFLGLGCLRGFTLIPATSLVLLGVAFFPPGRLFVLTLAGIVVSSASIYVFAEALHLDDLLRRRHGAQLERVRDLLIRHELPIIIGWSFFPFVPTDLICYLCGVLRVNLARCLVGVAIGEGAICAIYIFGGDLLLRVLHVKG